MLELIIIDDHQLFRKGIESLLEGEEDIYLVKQYSEGQKAIEKIKEDLPDLYLLDIALNKENGLDVAKRIKSVHPNQKILMLSMHTQHYYLKKAMEIGVDGYVHKDIDPDELIKAIKVIGKGKKYFSDSISENLIKNAYNVTKSSQFSIAKLTDREKEIVRLLVKGLSSKEISEELTISKRTVESHRYKILNKFSLKTTVDLVRLTMEEGFI